MNALIVSGRNTDRVSRIHVIDGCQALNKPPYFEYQRIVPDGPHRDEYLSPVSAQSFSEFCKKCRVPAKARLQLLQWIIFNLLIGNTDCHGKNLSYFVGQDGYELAPYYDLVNLTVYEDFNHELAFKIGGTFVLSDVNAYQLLEMSQEVGLVPRFVATQLKKLCKDVLKQIGTFEIDDLTTEERIIIEKLVENIKLRTNVFLKLAAHILSLAKSE